MRGDQEPRVRLVPAAAVSSAGREAVECAARAGLILDPWQQTVLAGACGELADGKWAAFEVGVCVARQNGKDGILEARELAGLFAWDERLIIHSAHQFDTSQEHFSRLLALIENAPEFDRRVAKVVRSHGEEGIVLKGGQRIRFRTRTKGGGRGFSADTVILNEAMILSEMAHGALLPTLSARPNPQVWYTGSPVDQTVHDHGVVFARVRDRGVQGSDPTLAYFEWGLGYDRPDLVPAAEIDSVDAWAQANPGLGIRIDPGFVAAELRAMDPRTFAVERLGVGDWPAVDGVANTVLSVTRWLELADQDSEIVGPVWFAFDVTPDRGFASIAACGSTAAGLAHVEITDRKPGTAWVPARLAALTAKHATAGVTCDGYGPAASLIPEMTRAGVHVATVTAKEVGHACGGLYDAVDQGTIRHLNQPELLAAIKGSSVRPLGDAWAWSRKSSSTDISPLVAVTLAHWRHAAAPATAWVGWGGN